ncbi:MAG: glycosyltransferase [Clostridia bacterium]|nr:glycosyltransferase [Clostridia bacterium]
MSTRVFSKKRNVSILITYYNKEYELSLILEALLLQTIIYENFEIVIVDDGSDNSIKHLITDYETKGLCIIFVRIAHGGNRAYNRSLAVSHSTGEYLIFLDADMIPSPTFIEKHLDNLVLSDTQVSLGFRNLLINFPRELITPEILKNNFSIIENLPHCLDERVPLVYAHKKLKLNLSKAWFMAYSHNIALKRSLYEKITGFDENFRFGWGVEDIDFAYQLYKAGASFVYDKDISLFHIPHTTENNVKERYEKNLLYFYNKHKTYETEIFQIQHLLDPISLCSLYKRIEQNCHLQDFNSTHFTDYENTLFVGFKNRCKSKKINGNYFISTIQEAEDYNLIGFCLPFEKKQFKKVILSNKYSVFSTELLFRVIKELSRVGNEIQIYESDRMVSLDDFWRERTGYSFSEFQEIKKVRVIISPFSDNRMNNVLYLELLKALNENGYYAGLEITYDEFKDFDTIYPFCCENNELLKKYYQRNIQLCTEPVYTLVDALIAGNNKNQTDNLYWWGDVPYQYKSESEFLNKKKFYKKCFLRNSDEHSVLRPGIRADEINEWLINQNEEKKPGIVIFDLLLEYSESLKEIINQINKGLSKEITITIVVLNPILSETELIRNMELYFSEKVLQNQKNRFNQVQIQYTERLEKLINSISGIENVQVITINGNLDEATKIIQKNTLFLDISIKKDFNPYLLQASAYGLQVLTSSDAYRSYQYPNIQEISTEQFFDLKTINTKVPIEELIKINERNSWKNILVENIFD